MVPVSLSGADNGDSHDSLQLARSIHSLESAMELCWVAIQGDKGPRAMSLSRQKSAKLIKEQPSSEFMLDDGHKAQLDVATAPHQVFLPVQVPTTHRRSKVSHWYQYRFARPVLHGDTEQAPAVQTSRLTRPVSQVGNNVPDLQVPRPAALYSYQSGINKQSYHRNIALRK